MANDQNNPHTKTKRIIKIVGVVLLLCGLAMIVVGVVDFIKALGRRDFPSLFWLIMLGFILLGVGGGFAMSGFRNEIARLASQEQTLSNGETEKSPSPAENKDTPSD